MNIAQIYREATTVAGEKEETKDEQRAKSEELQIKSAREESKRAWLDSAHTIELLHHIQKLDKELIDKVVNIPDGDKNQQLLAKVQILREVVKYATRID